MKITDKTTPTGGMTEERARELLETPGTVFVINTAARVVTHQGWLDLWSCRAYSKGRACDDPPFLYEWRCDRLHFRDAELILRDFVEGEA